MDINQIIVICIIVLFALIIVLGAYFLFIFLHNKKHDKKIQSIFDPNKLIEEESLLNTMDKKRNIEPVEMEREDKNSFIDVEEGIDRGHSNVKEQPSNVINNTNGVINPFNVDLGTQKTPESGAQSNGNGGKFF